MVPYVLLFTENVLKILNVHVSDEFKHALCLSKPRIVFCSSRVLGKVLSVLGSAPWVEQVLVLDAGGTSGGRGAQSVDAILSRTLEPSSPDDYNCQDVPETRDVVATVLCSSGTTGLPKGVEATQHNILTVLATLK